MAFIAIICINPQNQDEKVKANFNHLINGLLVLVKQIKIKTPEKAEEELEEEEEIDEEEVRNKFNVIF